MTPPASAKSMVSEGLTARLRRGLTEYWSSVGLFSRNARLYLIGWFLIGFNVSCFQLLLNLYLKELGYLEGDIGVIQSYRALGMTAVAIPAALLMSRMRLKPLLLLSCLLLGGFSVGLIALTKMTALMTFGALTGVAATFFQIAAGPFYMRNSTARERTHLFSLSFAAHLVAGMIGSWGAGSLVTYVGVATGDMLSGYRVALYVAAGISVLAMIPFALIRGNGPTDEESRISLTVEQLRRRGGFYFKISLVNFLIGAGAGLIIPFLNLYFRDRFGLQPDQIGFYYILLSLGMLVGTLCGPLLTPHLGLVRTIVLTQVASIPFMLTLSYSYLLLLAVPAFVLRGGLMNLGVPLSNNFSMELSEKKERGLVNALLGVSWTGSWMVSVAIGGQLIEHYGYTLVLNITAGLYVVSSLTYYLFFGSVEQRHADRPGWYIPQDTRM